MVETENHHRLSKRDLNDNCSWLCSIVLMSLLRTPSLALTSAQIRFNSRRASLLRHGVPSCPLNSVRTRAFKTRPYKVQFVGTNSRASCNLLFHLLFQYFPAHSGLAVTRLSCCLYNCCPTTPLPMLPRLGILLRFFAEQICHRRG